MIGNLEQKRNSMLHLLDDCADNYHNPEKFFTYLDSLIQTARNFTFAIQANKKNINNFDTWYANWVEEMKKDQFMNWLKNTRTEVVHEDIIASKSYAALVTLPDYSEPLVEEHYDYKLSTEDLTKLAAKILETNPGLSHSVLHIERNYFVTINGVGFEVVRVLAHIVLFLDTMYMDLDKYLETGESSTQGLEIVKNVTIDDSYRYFQFKLKSGEPISSKVKRVEIDEDAMNESVKRYGKNDLHTITGQQPAKAARILYRAAKRMLEVDGSYLPMVFIKNDEGYLPSAVLFRDRAEKILFTHELAARVKEIDGNAVIFISETWIVDKKKGSKRLNEGKNISDMRNKKEALSLMMLQENGETLTISTRFNRVNNQIVYEKDIVEKPEPKTLGFLLPIYNLWLKNPKS